MSAAPPIEEQQADAVHGNDRQRREDDVGEIRLRQSLAERLEHRAEEHRVAGRPRGRRRVGVRVHVAMAERDQRSAVVVPDGVVEAAVVGVGVDEPQPREAAGQCQDEKQTQRREMPPDPYRSQAAVVSSPCCYSPFTIAGVTRSRRPCCSSTRYGALDRLRCRRSKSAEVTARTETSLP